MQHSLRLLPHIQMLLPHGKQNRDILFCHNVPLFEDGPLALSRQYLRDIMAEHVPHSLCRIDQFHYFVLFPVNCKGSCHPCFSYFSGSR